MLARVAIVFLAIGPGPAQAAERADVPIGQIAAPDGRIRYYVPVSIDGKAPIRAMLDTGSTGLRVLKSAVEPSLYKGEGRRGQYRFTNGARFEGPVVRARVSIGPLATARPVEIQVVDHVACVRQKPDCPVSNVAFEDFRMAGGGVPGQGFDAILGTSLRKPAHGPSAENPLRAIGEESWIVVLPRPGAREAGHLVINPTAADRAGFALVKLRRQRDPDGPGEAGGDERPGWRDGALAGCLVDDSTKNRSCGNTLLDSGASGFDIDTLESKEHGQWAAGTRVTFEIGGAERPIRFSFVAGADPATRARVHPARDPDFLRLSAGTRPYLAYEVLYDGKAGSMGFKPREPAE